MIGQPRDMDLKHQRTRTLHKVAEMVTNPAQGLAKTGKAT